MLNLQILWSLSEAVNLDQDKSPKYFRNRGLRDQDVLEEMGQTTRSGSDRDHESATRDQDEQRSARSGREPRCYDEASQGSESLIRNYGQNAHGCYLRMLKPSQLRQRNLS
ncbi:hypothetical protein ACOSQ4_017122 [Xanthoceras sorbifolium]